MVDESETTVLHLHICPSVPVVSYLTPITVSTPSRSHLHSLSPLIFLNPYCISRSISLSLSLPCSSHTPPCVTLFQGIVAGDLANGVSKQEALAQVHALLGPDVILVGQRPQSDIKWLQLLKHVHYSDFHDLSQTFSAFNPKFKNTSFFTLQHEASTLLNMDMSGAHDPSEDARVSIRLYKKYALGPKSQLEAAKKK